LPGAKPFDPPAPIRFALRNGLEVVLLARHAAPLVGLHLVVRGGASVDPADKAGLASLVADLLDEGAGTRGTIEFAEAIEQLGAQLETASGQESSHVLCEVLGSRFDEALPLVADLVQRPRFDAKEFDRIKAEHVAHLIQRRVEPHAVARIALGAALYGDSAYGRPVDGMVASVQSLTLADVRRQYGAYYHPNNAVLLVAGDIT